MYQRQGQRAVSTCLLAAKKKRPQVGAWSRQESALRLRVTNKESVPFHG